MSFYDINMRNDTDFLLSTQKKGYHNHSLLRRSFSQISDKIEHEEQSRNLDPEMSHLNSSYKNSHIDENMEKEKLFLMKRLQIIKEEIKKYQRDVFIFQKNKDEWKERNCMDADNLIKSLLDSNNYFLANQSQPKILVDDTIPSALPVPVENPIPQLQIFNQLRFYDTSNRIISSEEHGHLIREHRLKGDFYNGHVFFDIKMLVD
ncbi:hypothetical protein PCK2_000974, partial [Pneumocystis canis]